jgi:hypothetical protein
MSARPRWRWRSMASACRPSCCKRCCNRCISRARTRARPFRFAALVDGGQCGHGAGACALHRLFGRGAGAPPSPAGPWPRSFGAAPAPLARRRRWTRACATACPASSLASLVMGAVIWAMRLGLGRDAGDPQPALSGAGGAGLWRHRRLTAWRRWRLAPSAPRTCGPGSGVSADGSGASRARCRPAPARRTAGSRSQSPRSRRSRSGCHPETGCQRPAGTASSIPISVKARSRLAFSCPSRTHSRKVKAPTKP